MQASIPDVDMADSHGSDASSNSSLAVYEPQGVHFDPHEFNDDPMLDFVPDMAFTQYPPELTAYLPGDAGQHPGNHHNNNVAPIPQTPTFDPRALLNPKSANSNSKRPASSGGDADRGRTDPTIAGQVSLVERLHNVQERTASPAKRVKTDETRKKASNGSSFGGSALDLQNTNGHVSTPQQGPSIDLTMSEYLKTCMHSSILTDS